MKYIFLAVLSITPFLAIASSEKDIADTPIPKVAPSTNPLSSHDQLRLAASSQVCCLSREPVDSGRRIGPVYRVRSDYCEKGEETVEMKFCKGPF